MFLSQLPFVVAEGRFALTAIDEVPLLADITTCAWVHTWFLYSLALQCTSIPPLLFNKKCSPGSLHYSLQARDAGMWLASTIPFLVLAIDTPPSTLETITQLIACKPIRAQTAATAQGIPPSFRPLVGT